MAPLLAEEICLTSNHPAIPVFYVRPPPVLGLPQQPILIPSYPSTLPHPATQETFPEFLDVIYWFRQILALIIGLVWGQAPSLGGPAIMSFVGLVRFVGGREGGREGREGRRGYGMV